MTPENQQDQESFLPMAASVVTADDENGCSALYKKRFVVGVPHIAGIICSCLMIGAGLSRLSWGKSVIIQGRADKSSGESFDSSLKSLAHRNGTNGTAVEYIDVETKIKTSFNEDKSNGPRVAWLMSFPNSGTSFTLEVVRHSSRTHTATNYGEENIDPLTGGSIPLYASGTTEGPFWTEQLSNPKYEKPRNFVLTKTHCGGRCEKCGPSKYVENPHLFLKACLSGKRGYRAGEGNTIFADVSYDPGLVARAVHLIRNPFDNAVSRFHLEVHKYQKANDAEKMKMYPSNRDGFRAFCRMLDERYAREEKTSHLIDLDILAYIKNVPCHGDFFRFTQWHNLAFVTTHDLQLPTYVLHYENYTENFDRTLEELLSFLQLEQTGEKTEFVKGKAYADYFTVDEQAAVRKAAEKLASRETWSHINHYFG